MVEILVDGRGGGAPAGEQAAQAALALGAGELALQGVLRLLEGRLGALDVVLVELAAAGQPLPEEHDHANEPLDHRIEKHDENEGEEHVPAGSCLKTVGIERPSRIAKRAGQ